MVIIVSSLFIVHKLKGKYNFIALNEYIIYCSVCT